MKDIFEKGSEEPGNIQVEYAAEEAAMMQGYLEKLRNADYTPSSEDYDKAIKIVDDLKVAAANEPNEFKRTALIERIMTTYVGYPLALAIAILWLPDEIGTVKERARLHTENWIGPSRRLEIMKKAGEKYLKQ